MAITFDGIPASVRTPGFYIEFDSSRAVQGVQAQPHVALIFGMGLPTGAVAEDVPTRIASYEEAEAAWGRGSIIANMFAAFKAANQTTEVWGISSTAEVGTAATWTITLTGPATAAGTVALYIEGRKIETAIPDTTSANDAAVLIDAAINASNALPGPALVATAGVATNVVTLTARAHGTHGNDIDVRVNYQEGDATPAGLTVAIAAGAAGATDPALTAPIAAMADTQYHSIACDRADDTNMDLLEAELATRWGPLVQLEGHAFISVNDTLANVTTAGNARNSKHTCLVEGGGVVAFSPTPPWIRAAVAAAITARERQIDPFRPTQTLVLPGVLPPAKSDQFTRAERDILLTDGVATTKTGADGLVRIERMITTYQTNAAAISDVAYLDSETVFGLGLLRFQLRTWFGTRFPRHKLASDAANFGPGQKIVTPAVAKASLYSLFRQWEDAGYVEDFDQYKSELIVEINTSDVNRLDAQMGPNLINQFRVFAGQMQFLL